MELWSIRSITTRQNRTEEEEKGGREGPGVCVTNSASVLCIALHISIPASVLATQYYYYYYHYSSSTGRTQCWEFPGTVC